MKDAEAINEELRRFIKEVSYCTDNAYLARKAAALITRYGDPDATDSVDIDGWLISNTDQSLNAYDQAKSERSGISDCAKHTEPVCMTCIAAGRQGIPASVIEHNERYDFDKRGDEDEDWVDSQHAGTVDFAVFPYRCDGKQCWCNQGRQ